MNNLLKLAEALEQQVTASKYGSLPARGHAESELRNQGYTDIVYKGHGMGSRGPVLIYEAELHGSKYRINIGRLDRSDKLEILSSPILPS